jgi:2-polyprenyl-3-methyl-5-hydroxy-6-metoxy-1,4-benzoquinol methylase
MDQPDLDPARHAHALRGLARINLFSGSDRILWKPIRRLAAAQGGRALRLLDLATGGGDVPIRLWRRARRAGINLDIHAADVSLTALDYAHSRAQAEGAKIEFFRIDALADDWPAGFDVVTSSLFLHHLADEQALVFLQKMRQAAGQMALVNDLARSRLGYVAAWLGTRVLTASDVVHIDGPRSVAAAFTLAEVRGLAERAGWTGASLARRWPWRFLLEWRRDP